MSDRILKVRNPEIKEEIKELWDKLDSLRGTNTPDASSPYAARNILAFNGDASAGETITVGVDTYEFTTDGTVEAGNIVVDISGGATASDAVTAVVAASANGTEPITAEVINSGGNIGVGWVADIAGVLANAIVTTTTCANAIFIEATLTEGLDGIIGEIGDIRVSSHKLYIATDTCTISESHWKNITIS